MIIDLIFSCEVHYANEEGALRSMGRRPLQKLTAFLSTAEVSRQTAVSVCRNFKSSTDADESLTAQRINPSLCSNISRSGHQHNLFVLQTFIDLP